MLQPLSSDKGSKNRKKSNKNKAKEKKKQMLNRKSESVQSNESLTQLWKLTILEYDGQQ